MKNKKGQALVEFVIILPIFIFMLLSIIDIGKVIYFQNQLVSELNDVVDLYKNQKTYEEILNELNLQDEGVTLEIKNQDNEIITFYLKRDVEIITPGLNVIFDNPHTVTVERALSYE
ncbi:TPA: pilus assembly protein [Candidatus Ventrenecus stercoripullorum]|nr:pilus assembly protein [Candidatus Ventrenecus stercoripullorum]